MHWRLLIVLAVINLCCGRTSGQGKIRDAALVLNQSQVTKSALRLSVKVQRAIPDQFVKWVRVVNYSLQRRDIKKTHPLKWSWWETSRIRLQQKSRKTFRQQQRCSNSSYIRHTEARTNHPNVRLRLQSFLTLLALRHCVWHAGHKWYELDWGSLI